MSTVTDVRPEDAKKDAEKFVTWPGGESQKVRDLWDKQQGGK